MSKTVVSSDTSATGSSRTKSFTPIGDLLKQSWDILTVSWKNLLLLSIILWAIVFILTLVIGGSVVGSFALAGNASEMLGSVVAAGVGIGVVVGLGILVAASAFGTAMMIAVAEAKQQPPVGSLISRGFKLFLPVFLTSLLMIFFVYGGFFLFVIPGIVVAIFTGFSIYEVVFTENRYMDAIKNSVRIVGQNFGELFVRVLVVIGLSIGLVILQSILQNLVGEDSGAQGLIGLLMMIVQTGFGWFIMGYYYIVYKEARALTDFNKGGSTVWLWIIAVLGWLIGVFILFAASAFITALVQKGGLNDLYNEANDMESDMVPGMYDSENLDTEQLLEDYGQEMTEEEKAQFRDMMMRTETMMEEDRKAAEQEAAEGAL